MSRKSILITMNNNNVCVKELNNDIYTRSEMKWYLIYVLNCPIPPYFIVPPSLHNPPTLQINMALLMVLECVWVEKRFAAWGTHQPHPQVHLAYMHTDGGTWGWWTLFAALNLALVHLLWCPPAEYKGVAYWQGSPPLKLEGQLERQTSLPGLQDWELQVLWTLEGADGRWWWMGYGRFSCEGVRLRIGRNVTLLPSEAHRNPLPLNLPLLLPFFPIPPSPGAGPLSPICRPPPSGNQPFSAGPAPER